MLRAGLAKLRKLEKDFSAIDPNRHPKMLVVCEDTTVSPLVAEFLRDQEGLNEDEVMTIDSGKKAELGEKDWAPVRERLFSVDHHATPRVIVSVLMLREGFDVNNICVIVPLRSSQAQILLEQTIGRGLRLMWRDAEYNDIKRENRELIEASQEPGSLLDVLSIVEHPAFQSFYDELINEGLAGTTGDDDGDPRVLAEAQRIQGDEHHFILGYYYRLVGRQRDAVEQLTRVVTGAFVGVRAKRELVEVLLQMEQYDEARDLARRNYEENRTNQFHIQAYFRALVLGSNPERHLAQLEILCTELEVVGSERSRQMAMIGRALISARCAHDERALDLIDDAIAAFPRVIYPALAKFDIGRSFRNETAMLDALHRLNALGDNGANLSTKTLGMQRAYLAAVQGDLMMAQSSANEVTKNFTDVARKKFNEKLAAIAEGAQTRTDDDATASL